ncbi:hypothetical protein GCM10007862_27560 [Dyella lipolytica]|nr:hypothetical protein GCM10007862_27560 [Dyella lipolytica]
MLVDMHSEQRGHQQGVAKAAYGKEFRDTLQHAQEDQKPQAHASFLLKSVGHYVSLSDLRDKSRLAIIIRFRMEIAHGEDVGCGWR